jgi:prepilin-type N-terminal cleavage/methylation domain-containing protein
MIIDLYLLYSIIRYCIIKICILKEGDRMNLSNLIKNKKGFTLIEVLVSITILGIVLMSFMNFFMQAGSFTNMNQKKTVAVNVARNALMFVEHQSYLKVYGEFPIVNKVSTPPKIYDKDLYICNDSYEYFDQNSVKPSNCKNITINNLDYKVKIKFEEVDKNDPSIKYYLPIKVEVGWTINDHEYSTSVNGTIKSEDIR